MSVVNVQVRLQTQMKTFLQMQQIVVWPVSRGQAKVMRVIQIALESRNAVGLSLQSLMTMMIG